MYIPELPPMMRVRRQTSRLTQADAAREIGIAPVTYGSAERTGRMQPRTARAIERWLHGQTLTKGAKK